MMKGLVTVLLLITSVAAGIEPITIIGTPHLETTYAIYQALGGTFNLSSSGIKGFENAYISHLIFDGNLTSLSSLSHNRTTLPSPRSLNLVHSKRAPVQYNSFQCTTTGEYEDGSLFTVAQQQFLSGTACNAFATITPALWGLAGMVITKTGCKLGSGWSGFCSTVITVAAAEAGQYIQPAWQQACQQSYDAIEAKCGLAVGSASITTTADNQEYNIDMYTTGESASGLCPATATNTPAGLGMDCFTTSCGANQCIPNAIL